uniref:Uncharacterized protein n=1 Tax=Pristionchus pacificus TaxID=54126 RepID=A0A2A6CHT6_PRIPA|eukprot:PDM77623.1 hypothetical protein PRIPAC_34490 [Pristionchus pacificus]
MATRKTHASVAYSQCPSGRFLVPVNELERARLEHRPQPRLQIAHHFLVIRGRRCGERTLHASLAAASPFEYCCISQGKGVAAAEGGGGGGAGGGATRWRAAAAFAHALC